MNNGTPKLRNLCEFVKKQAKIKNDPLFSAVSLQTTTERKPERQKQYTGYSYKPNREKQTSTFLTNTSSSPQRDKSAYVSNRTQNDNLKPKLKCPYCGDNHLLPQCGKFQDLDIQNRWTFVKTERLCHACLLAGHFRTVCTLQNYCTCTTERKHHPLLHNDRGVREQYNQTFETQKPETKSNYATFVHPLKKAVLLHVSAVALVSPDGNIVTT
ncbi:hypothetical protein SNE40_021969 [Patella caerulea]|uniref:Uncharacterized protein n=1 Tax=Patella caerulea TaxID=87958 RepID=A0AAN8G8Y0_PATCE